MAEIKIEKKNNNWIWIIVAVIVIGLLIWLFTSRNNNDENRRNQRTVPPTEQPAPENDRFEQPRDTVVPAPTSQAETEEAVYA
jgi:hypothetical protein